LIAALLAMAAAPSSRLSRASLVVGITAGFAQLIIRYGGACTARDARACDGALLACLFLGILSGAWREAHRPLSRLAMDLRRGRRHAAALAPALALWLPSMPAKTRSATAACCARLRVPARQRDSAARIGHPFLSAFLWGFWATVAPMMLALHGSGRRRPACWRSPARREYSYRSRPGAGRTAAALFPSSRRRVPGARGLRAFAFARSGSAP